MSIRPIYKIKDCHTSCQEIDTVTNLDSWLEDEAAQHEQIGLEYLIAFALDGLFWGHLDDGKWAKKSASTEWNEEYVQEVRLFGEDDEIHLWRVGDQWHGRRIDDRSGDDFLEMIDDQYILWGDTAEKQEDGFTLLADGQQGLRHWLPELIATEHLASLRLTVRHYLAAENVAHIIASRLVTLQFIKGNNNVTHTS